MESCDNLELYVILADCPRYILAAICNRMIFQRPKTSSFRQTKICLIS
jgi:hypothetical protein